MAKTPIISIVGGANAAILADRKFAQTICFATVLKRAYSRDSAPYALTTFWLAIASWAVSVSSLLPSKDSRERFLKARPNFAVSTPITGAIASDPRVSRQ